MYVTHTKFVLIQSQYHHYSTISLPMNPISNPTSPTMPTTNQPHHPLLIKLGLTTNQSNKGEPTSQDILTHLVDTNKLQEKVLQKAYEQLSLPPSTSKTPQTPTPTATIPTFQFPSWTTSFLFVTTTILNNHPIPTMSTMNFQMTTTTTSAMDWVLTH